MDVFNITLETTSPVFSHNNTTNLNTTGPETTLDDILKYIKPKIYHWIFVCLYIIMFVVGLTGNFLVCYAVWKSTPLKTVTNFFLVNLAAADFLVILLCLPLTAVYEMLQSWMLGVELCKFVIYIQKVSVFVSILTLTVISIERYLAILHPLTFHGESRRTRLVIAVIWIISLLTPAADLMNIGIMHNPQVPEHLRPWLSACLAKDIELEKNLFIFYTVTFYVLPLLVMSYTYVRIAVCLWSSTSQENAFTENLQHQSAVGQLRARRRSAKMLIVVVVTFGVCYLPIYTLNIYRYTSAFHYMDRSVASGLFHTARLIQYFNSSINPVIYNFMSVKFRKQFRLACFGCYRCCFKSSYMGDVRTSQYSMRRYVNKTDGPHNLPFFLTSKKHHHSVVLNRSYLTPYHSYPQQNTL